METTAFVFALAGVSFGLIGFTTAAANSAKIKKLEEKIAELESNDKKEQD